MSTKPEEIIVDTSTKTETRETLRALARDPKLRRSFEEFARSAIIWAPRISLCDAFIIWCEEARK